MNQSEHQELLEQIEQLFHPESGLGEQERAQLIKQINQSDETRMLYLQHCELEAAIRDVAPYGAFGQSTRSSFATRWRPLSIAAIALLGLFVIFQIFVPSASAEAALAKSLEAISKPVLRKYSLQVAPDSIAGAIVQHDIYLRGRDQFAMKIRGRSGELWMGKRSANDAWILQPSGPVLQGDAKSVFGWLSTHRESLHLPEMSRPNTPFLHLPTALNAVTKGYQLTKLADETLSLNDGTQVSCQRFRAERIRAKRSDIPEVIELWTSRALDIPIKMVATWSDTKSKKVYQRSIELFYQGQPDPTVDWFAAGSHYEGHREVETIK